MLNFKNIQKWYNRADVKFQLIKYLRKRELSLLVPSWVAYKEIRGRSVRMLRCHSVQHMDYILNKGLRMFEKQTPYNFYYSIASYIDGIPYQTFNLREKKDENKVWTKTHLDYIEGYDFFIDIDAGEHSDLEYAYSSAVEIKNFFDYNLCPYEIVFSGKGFHFKIPFCYLPFLSFNKSAEKNIYKFCSIFAKKINNKFSEMVDLNIYDSRRLCKIPYSLSLYEDKTFVCFQFCSDLEFNNFDCADFEIEKFDIPLRYRNRKVFNEAGNINRVLKALEIDYGT